MSCFCFQQSLLKIGIQREKKMVFLQKMQKLSSTNGRVVKKNGVDRRSDNSILAYFLLFLHFPLNSFLILSLSLSLFLLLANSYHYRYNGLVTDGKWRSKTISQHCNIYLCPIHFSAFPLTIFNSSIT